MRQTHALHQALEARIRTHRREGGILSDAEHLGSALVVGLLQPLECFFFTAKGGTDFRSGEGDIAGSVFLNESAKNLLCLRLSSPECVSVAKFRLGKNIGPIERNYLLELFRCLRIVATR